MVTWRTMPVGLMMKRPLRVPAGGQGNGKRHVGQSQASIEPPERRGGCGAVAKRAQFLGDHRTGEPRQHRRPPQRGRRSPWRWTW